MKKKRSVEYADASRSELFKKPPEKEVQSLRKRIEELKIRCKHDQREKETFQDLLEEGAVSEREFTHCLDNHEQSKEQLDGLICQLDKLCSGPSHETLMVAEALVEKREAEYKTVENQIENLSLKSPIDGVVLSIDSHLGEVIGKDPVMVVGSISPMYLKVLVPEKDAWKISPTRKLRAIAQHRDNTEIYSILKFEKVNPIFRSNEDKEKMLELIFSLDPGNSPLYLEERLDVFIEAKSPNDTSYIEYQFEQQERGY